MFECKICGEHNCEHYDDTISSAGDILREMSPMLAIATPLSGTAVPITSQTTPNTTTQWNQFFFNYVILKKTFISKYK